MTTDSATKILVADDDLEVLALVARHLSLLPAEVVEASDGEEALRLARREKPNLVVLDVMMPGLNGFEVCRKLKEQSETKDVPVIFVSGHDMGDRTSELLSLGAKGVLQKPYSVQKLMDSLEPLAQTPKSMG